MGTISKILIFFQSIRKYDVVDIFGIVYEMRKERVWMVQTEQQYICIHQCLLTVISLIFSYFPFFIKKYFHVCCISSIAIAVLQHFEAILVPNLFSRWHHLD